MVHQLVRPGEEQVRLVPPVALQRLAGERFVRFERPAVSLRIRRGHDAHRRKETIARSKRSEEHTSELQSPVHLVCRLLLEKKKHKINNTYHRQCINKSSTC